MSELQSAPRAQPNIVNFIAKNTFLVIFLLFVFSRLLILLTGIEQVLWPEEFYRGTIAKELLSGLKASLWDYQADDYDGGSLMIGVLASILFWLFGDNLFSLKLVPFFLSSVTLALTYRFLERFFSRQTAIYASLLYIFSPPTFTALTLVAIGSHPESILFSVGMVFLLYLFLFDDQFRRREVLIAFGLLSGIAFWYTSITFITFLACLLTWRAVSRRPLFSPDLLWIIGAFVIGLAPWIFYNVSHNFSGLNFLLSSFLPGGMYPTVASKFTEFFIKVVRLCLQTIPFSLYTYPIFKCPAPYFSFAYVVTAVFLMVKIDWRSRKLFFFFCYPILFVLIYGLTNYGAYNPLRGSFFQDTYFTPVYFFLLLLLGISASEKGKSILFFGLLLLGLLGQTSLLAKEPFARGLSYPGYSYFDLGNLWQHQSAPFPEGLSRFIQFAEKFTPARKNLLYWGYTSFDNFDWSRPEAMEGVTKAIESIPNGQKIYFWEALGNSFASREWERSAEIITVSKGLPTEGLGYFFHGVAMGAILNFRQRPKEQCLADILHWPDGYRQSFYFEFGKSLQYHFRNRPEELKATFRSLTKGLGGDASRWILRGLGLETANQWIFSKKAIREMLSSDLYQSNPRDFFWGVGWGIMESILEGRERALDWINRIPDEEARTYAREGFDAFEQFYRIGV